MFEITIKDKTYQFNFGFGFLKEINKAVTVDVDGLKDVKKNIGLRFKLAQLLDYDTEALVDVLLAANKGQNPRVSQNELEIYIDSEDTDIEKLFEDVWGFLRSANATKKMVEAWEADVEAEKAARAKSEQN